MDWNEEPYKPKPATKKQMELVQKICYSLKYKYVITEMTKQEAFLFIQDHIKEYRKWCRKNLYSYNYYEDSSKKEYSENPYAGPYGTDIVDCYDFGIFPWGNS